MSFSIFPHIHFGVVLNKPMDIVKIDSQHPFPLPKKLRDMGYTEEELDKDNPYTQHYGVTEMSDIKMATFEPEDGKLAAGFAVPRDHELARI